MTSQGKKNKTYGKRANDIVTNRLRKLGVKIR